MTDPLVLFRAIHIAATVLASGTVAFAVFVAEPAARTAGAVSIDSLRGQLNVTVWCALAVGAIAEAAWLIWLSADIYGAPVIAVCLHGGVWTVFTDTRFGLVSAIRLGLAAVLAVLILWPAARLLQFVAAAGLIGLLAFVGHAGATPGMAGTIHLASDMVHLLAAGGWLGGLPALALVFAHTRRADNSGSRQFAIGVTRRFSRLGAICVGALLISGIVNSCNLLNGPRDLVATDYGRLIFMKIGLFIAMLGIAATNRFHFTPQLPSARALYALQRNSLAETGLGLVVLLFVGALGTLSPSGHAHSINADVPPDAVFVHIHTADAMAEVAVSAGRIGEANAHIRILRDDFSEYPTSSVELTLEPPGAGRKIARAAARLPDGTWEVNGLELPQAGVWTVRLIIANGDGRPLVLDAPIVIESGQTAPHS
ncbi:MAG TPA: copper homeostasis membrane protein CopD [Pseudolabrys sp.]|nr:copper homeostasis membrane protein CopD [Pseudolabrys sp.]